MGAFTLMQQNKILIVSTCCFTSLSDCLCRVPGHELHKDIVQEPGAVNWTAANLTVKHMTPPPKPKTMLTSKLGKYVYYTENVFEQELYAGNQRGQAQCLYTHS